MMKKNVAECLSTRTVELYLEAFGDERNKQKAEVERSGIKVIKGLDEALNDLKKMQDVIEPFCDDIDLMSGCQGIDDLLNDIESDNNYLEKRLNIVKNTLF